MQIWDKVLQDGCGIRYKYASLAQAEAEQQHLSRILPSNARRRSANYPRICFHLFLYYLNTSKRALLVGINSSTVVSVAWWFSLSSKRLLLPNDQSVLPPIVYGTWTGPGTPFCVRNRIFSMKPNCNINKWRELFCLGVNNQLIILPMVCTLLPLPPPLFLISF